MISKKSVTSRSGAFPILPLGGSLSLSYGFPTAGPCLSFEALSLPTPLLKGHLTLCRWTGEKGNY